MGKVEIRPGVWMAYEDHWFGEPWTVPETVVMVHGNSESSRAWTCWVPASRAPLPRRPPGPAGVWRIARAGRLRLERRRACRRHRALSRCARHRELSSDRRQIWRLGLHAACHRPAASPALALPVRLAGAGQRQRQRRPDPRQGRPAMGCRHHALAARQRGVRRAGEMVDRRADGQDLGARGLQRVGVAHRHGARERVVAHHRADADRDHAGERTAIGRGGRALCARASRFRA